MSSFTAQFLKPLWHRLKFDATTADSFAWFLYSHEVITYGELDIVSSLSSGQEKTNRLRRYLMEERIGPQRTLVVLVAALVDSEVMDLAHNIVKKLQEPGTREMLPRFQEMLQEGFADQWANLQGFLSRMANLISKDDPLQSDIIDIIRDGMARWYRQKVGRINLMPFLKRDKYTTAFKRLYTTPTTRLKINKKSIGLQEILRGKGLTNVIVGHPGSGKSVLCHKILLEWAEMTLGSLAKPEAGATGDSCGEGGVEHGKEGLLNELGKFTVCLFIQCRMLDDGMASSVKEYFSGQGWLSQDHSVKGISWETIWNRIVEEGERVLVIIDAYDELPSACDHQAPTESFQKLINRGVLSDATLLVTGRTDQCQVERGADGKLIEDMGFGEDQANSYIRAYCAARDKKEITDDLLDMITNSKALSEISKTPLFCCFLCLIAELQGVAAIKDITRTTIYRKTELLAVKRFCCEKLQDTTGSAEKQGEEFLSCLAKMTYELDAVSDKGTVSVRFHRDVYGKYISGELATFLKIPLLSEDFLVSDVVSEETYLSFFHPTFVEFLYAKRLAFVATEMWRKERTCSPLSCLAWRNRRKLNRKLHDLVERRCRTELTRRFFFGLLEEDRFLYAILREFEAGIDVREGNSGTTLHLLHPSAWSRDRYKGLISPCGKQNCLNGAPDLLETCLMAYAHKGAFLSTQWIFLDVPCISEHPRVQGLFSGVYLSELIFSVRWYFQGDHDIWNILRHYQGTCHFQNDMPSGCLLVSADALKLSGNDIGYSNWYVEMLKDLLLCYWENSRPFHLHLVLDFSSNAESVTGALFNLVEHRPSTLHISDINVVSTLMAINFFREPDRDITTIGNCVSSLRGAGFSCTTFSVVCGPEVLHSLSLDMKKSWERVWRYAESFQRVHILLCDWELPRNFDRLETVRNPPVSDRISRLCVELLEICEKTNCSAACLRRIFYQVFYYDGNSWVCTSGWRPVITDDYVPSASRTY